MISRNDMNIKQQFGYVLIELWLSSKVLLLLQNFTEFFDIESFKYHFQ